MWALGAYVIARWSDARGSRKPFLLTFLVIFSACSVFSGLAPSFPVLLIARAIMGAVEGPFLPVCLGHHGGRVITRPARGQCRHHAEFFSARFWVRVWRRRYCRSSPRNTAGGRLSTWRVCPGLVCAIAVWLVGSRTHEGGEATLHQVTVKGISDDGKTMALLRDAGGPQCARLLPDLRLHGGLVRHRLDVPAQVPYRGARNARTYHGLPPERAGLLSALSGFGAPWLSDRIGRKPVMIGFCLLAALTALGAVYFQGSTWASARCCLRAGSPAARFRSSWESSPVNPCRAICRHGNGPGGLRRRGLGGSGLVALAGKMADLTQLSTAVLMMAASGAIGAVLCFFLVETAPVKSKAAAVSVTTANVL